MKWPAQIKPGQTLGDPVHHFDIFSTVAAAAGAALPSDRKMDGVDLVAFTKPSAEGVPHEKLFWRSGASQTALVNGWKLNVSNPPGRSWLFDLRSDPNEQNDLSKEQPKKLAELQAALAAHNAEQVEPSWPSQASFAINIDKDLTVEDAPDDDYIYWSN
jgi:arylsulfatase A-like enzyme